MRIQNNIMAMNTHRMYTSNNNAVSKSAEKLSSGYRINRAGDDAAGLAISEKMRAQVRGLNMASKNSQDAISLVQTAEGALQEVHSMLQRMNELSVQSATGTNADFDRTQIAAEFDQLKSEIDQIAETTNFNNKKLLDGSLATVGKVSFTKAADAVALTGATFPATISANSSIELKLDLSKVKIGDVIGTTTVATTTDLSSDTAIATAFKGTANSAAYKDGVLTLTNSTATNINYVFTTAATNASVSSVDLTNFNFTPGAGFSITSGGNTYTFRLAGDGVTQNGTNDTLITGLTEDSTANQVAEAFRDAITTKAITGVSAVDVGGYLNINGAAITDATGEAAVGVVGGLDIQVGAEQGNTLNVSVDAMNSKALGLENISIDTQAKAGDAITATRDAVNTVSDMRARLGAMQNRLDHKISNLDNTAENLQAAESRIRDVDIAKEMTTYTKNNILSQAATAMLAQANAAPQNVLSLLQ